jgi:hypothetical protein
MHEHAQPGSGVRERLPEPFVIEWELVAGRGPKRQGNGKGGFLFDQRVAEQAVEDGPSVVGPNGK